MPSAAPPIPGSCLTFVSPRSLSSNVPFAVLLRADLAGRFDPSSKPSYHEMRHSPATWSCIRHERQPMRRSERGIAAACRLAKVLA